MKRKASINEEAGVHPRVNVQMFIISTVVPMTLAVIMVGIAAIYATI